VRGQQALVAQPGLLAGFAFESGGEKADRDVAVGLGERGGESLSVGVV
jgi:hypothetical protein